MTAATTIFSSVGKLPHVGEKRQKALNDLEIETIYDLLHHFPFRYEDLGEDDISQIEDKQTVVLAGEIISEPIVNYFAPKRSRLNFRMRVNHVVVPVVFFNQPYLKDKLSKDSHVLIYGKWDGLRKTLSGTRILGSRKEDIEDYEPVYPANKGITQKTIRKLIKSAYEKYANEIPEIVPDYLRSKYQLISHRQAIGDIHFPKSKEASHEAQREIKFSELFLYQLRLQAKKKSDRQTSNGQVIDYDVKQIQAFIDALPFEPTGAQKRVINEICRDFKSPFQMQRLLQGDVGSGKTLVAAAAMIGTWSAGKQAALMAPTEILAEQHFKTLADMFKTLDLKLALLTSSTKKAARDTMLEELKDGTIDVIIGTHALIQDDVLFKELAFVVTDEQHRFGVNQRQVFADKGVFPDILHMTATPIPRTLALTAFGDMDVSVLDEMPKGRKPVRTYWVRPKSEPRVFENVRYALETDSQVYVISPLIDESENLDLNTAVEIYEKYQQHFEPHYKVGLLHGQMKADEKEAVMSAFKNNDIQVLVSTTVIEVGVDVPNATLMVIYDADRFGLAQLHQLRGRVGRGEKESYCILIAEPKTDIGIKRLELMTEVSDGFVLSEKDLELRGPGDVFGKRQSGIPKFKLADLTTDYPILQIAHTEATYLLNQEAFYEDDEFELLRQLINH